MPNPSSLGALLRLLIARLDGDVQLFYDQSGTAFRPRYYPIVQHLMAHSQASVVELAAATGVTQPAATQTIAELERDELVERIISRDRRQRLVRLTTRGEEVVDQLRPLWRAIGKAAEELDRDLSAPLSAILIEALSALERAPFRDRIRRQFSDA